MQKGASDGRYWDSVKLCILLADASVTLHREARMSVVEKLSSRQSGVVQVAGALKGEPVSSLPVVTAYSLTT